MSEDTRTLDDGLSPSAVERILGVCEQFERAWRAGRIEDHCTLLAMEFELRRTGGERIGPGPCRPVDHPRRVMAAARATPNRPPGPQS
jgi:hypothetical protein